MSAEITLLFLEKRVEAAKLTASVTEPAATGSVPTDADTLAADFKQVSGELNKALTELKKLNGGLEKDNKLEAGDIRHIRGRIEIAVGEIARAAQDLAAQIRFFEAMNPNDAKKTKPALDSFTEVEKATREVTVKETEDEAELAPAEDTGMDKSHDDVDPMLM
jgi:hypothetical protein